MTRADQILARFEEYDTSQTVEQLVESTQDVNERDELTQRLVAGQLPREAEFWNLSVKDLTKVTGLRAPRGNVKVHDIIMWITRSANKWRQSIFYQDVLDRKKNQRDKKNAFVWVTPKT
ncbi:MAG: hypothetical protein GY833_12420 [Aestuariibacter sp.]|nr:hypothetical protein [Aestuariibacter sp.]|tara:strand:+ start:79743 stop:80099 length:357 start_codon:yes stop_codon:yes gene_type:complete